MFENSCDIRSNFLNRLEELVSLKWGSNHRWSLMQNFSLPQKKEIFQHVPLYSLYEKKFILSEKNGSKVDLPFLEKKNSSYLVFVNGRLDLSISNISACEPFLEIEEKKADFLQEEEHNFFMPLNYLLSSSEIHLSFKSDISSLEIINVITKDSKEGTLFSPRIVVNVKESVTCTLYFSLLNKAVSNYSWINQALFFNIDSGAKVDLYCHYKDLERAYFFDMIRAKQQGNSCLNIFSVMEGGIIEHKDIKVYLKKEGAECNIYAIALLKNCAQGHININVQHDSPHTSSDQLVKSVLQDVSRFGFEALVYINKLAQHSICHQLNNNLILSEKAQVFSKPFLKVLADEVKATHGATMSKLQEEDIFYLKARGLNINQSRDLLIKAFCQEILNPVNIQNMKNMLIDRINYYLG